jgi:glycosyltransferase involved in cell wall biosynthesis
VNPSHTSAVRKSLYAGRQPVVSVVIPTFNRADMVCEAIQSVREQTWPHVQIIVVDDGSTDDTVERLQGCEDILLLTQANAGQSAARNHGLRHATGEYLCTLDSDDLWNPTFLEQSINALETLGADFVFANWVGADTNGNRYDSYFQKFYHWWNFPETEVPNWRAMKPSQSRAMYIESCVSPSSSLVFRREQVVDGWSDRLRIGDDWCLLMDLVVRTHCKVAFTLQPLWTKRVAFDNIYDQRDYMEVKLHLHVHDVRQMRNRLARWLTPAEFARMSAHVAFHQWGLARHDLRNRKFRTGARFLAGSAVNLTRGLLSSPENVVDRVRSFPGRFHKPAPPAADRLQSEGIGSTETVVAASLDDFSKAA